MMSDSNQDMDKSSIENADEDSANQFKQND